MICETCKADPVGVRPCNAGSYCCPSKRKSQWKRLQILCNSVDYHVTSKNGNVNRKDLKKTKSFGCCLFFLIVQHEGQRFTEF